MDKAERAAQADPARTRVLTSTFGLTYLDAPVSRMRIVDSSSAGEDTPWKDMIHFHVESVCGRHPPETVIWSAFGPTKFERAQGSLGRANLASLLVR